MLEWTPRKAMVFQALGTAAAPFALYHMSALWVLLALVFWLIQNLVTTVALHRLFVHAAFECSRAWHYVLGFLSCLAMTSSPTQWAVAHYTHHRFSDTDRDPHNNKWAKRVGVVCLTRQDYDFSGAKRLLRDPLHAFLHRNYFGVNAVWVLVWFAVAGWQGACAAWMLPALGSMWIGAHHTAFAHKNNEPTNLAWPWGLIYLGEHLHKQHHVTPRLANYATERGQLDLGFWFIKAIRQPIQKDSRP